MNGQPSCSFDSTDRWRLSRSRRLALSGSLSVYSYYKAKHFPLPRHATPRPIQFRQLSSGLVFPMKFAQKISQAENVIPGAHSGYLNLCITIVSTY